MINTFIAIMCAFIIRDLTRWVYNMVTHKTVYDLGYNDAVFLQKQKNPFFQGYRLKRYAEGYTKGVQDRNAYRKQSR